MVMKHCGHKNKAGGNNCNRNESLVGEDLGVKIFWGKSLQVTRIKVGKCYISREILQGSLSPAVFLLCRQELCKDSAQLNPAPFLEAF